MHKLASLMFHGHLGSYIDEGMDQLESLLFRQLRGLRQRLHGQAGVSDVPATSGGYIDESMQKLASLMFRPPRGLHRRGHGQAGAPNVLQLRGLHRRGHVQAGVSSVLASSGAKSTRAWTGRRSQDHLGVGARLTVHPDVASRETLFGRRVVAFRRAQCRVTGRQTGQIFRVWTSGLQCCAQRISARLVPARLNPTRLAQSAALSRGVCQKKGSRGHCPYMPRENQGFLYTLCLSRC